MSATVGNGGKWRSCELDDSAAAMLSIRAINRAQSYFTADTESELLDASGPTTTMPHSKHIPERVVYSLVINIVIDLCREDI